MAPVIDDNDATELTELFGACDAKRLATEDNDGLLPCVGVVGAEFAFELYPEPNKRFVDENRREGRRLDDEYWPPNLGLA